MNNGLWGIMFRVKDHQNYYAFECFRDEEGGFKRIVRVVNG